MSVSVLIFQLFFTSGFGLASSDFCSACLQEAPMSPGSPQSEACQQCSNKCVTETPEGTKVLTNEMMIKMTETLVAAACQKSVENCKKVTASYRALFDQGSLASDVTAEAMTDPGIQVSRGREVRTAFSLAVGGVFNIEQNTGSYLVKGGAQAAMAPVSRAAARGLTSTTVGRAVARTITKRSFDKFLGSAAAATIGASSVVGLSGLLAASTLKHYLQGDPKVATIRECKSGISQANGATNYVLQIDNPVVHTRLVQRYTSEGHPVGSCYFSDNYDQGLHEFFTKSLPSGVDRSEIQAHTLAENPQLCGVIQKVHEKATKIPDLAITRCEPGTGKMQLTVKDPALQVILGETIELNGDFTPGREKLRRLNFFDQIPSYRDRVSMANGALGDDPFREYSTIATPGINYLMVNNNGIEGTKLCERRSCSFLSSIGKGRDFSELPSGEQRKITQAIAFEGEARTQCRNSQEDSCKTYSDQRSIAVSSQGKRSDLVKLQFVEAAQAMNLSYMAAMNCCARSGHLANGQNIPCDPGATPPTIIEAKATHAYW